MAWEPGVEAAISLGWIPERLEALRVDYWRDQRLQDKY